MSSVFQGVSTFAETMSSAFGRIKYMHSRLAQTRVTTITLGYDFNGCSGIHAFADVNVRTAPDVTCIPGPCAGAVASYRAFGYANGSFGSGPVTQVNGLFLPGNQARGQVAFFDYPGCGTATAVEWTAVKR